MRHGQKAVRAREAEAEQRSVFRLSGAAFVRGFVSAGRNERFQSLPPFVVFLAYPAITAKRIRNEEQVLENDLEGYAAYKERVKHRIIPLVW